MVCSQCMSKKSFIEGKKTICGIEPFVATGYKNLTTSLDGLTLLPFVPFLRKNSIAAFNDTNYHYTDGWWLQSKTNFKAVQAHNGKFPHITVGKSEQLLKNIPLGSENHFMSVLWELNGLLREQGTWSIGQYMETTKEKAIDCHSYSIFDKFENMESPFPFS